VRIVVLGFCITVREPNFVVLLQDRSKRPKTPGGSADSGESTPTSPSARL
jgi:hypothetical protein